MISRSCAAFLCSLAMTWPSLAQSPKKHSRPRVITQCSWGGNDFGLPDGPQATEIGSYNGIEVTGRMRANTGAVFTLSRNGRPLLHKTVVNVSNPNGWLGVSQDQQFFALNTSNGGATGGWSVSILHVTPTGTVEDLSSAMQVVSRDFSARHTCRTRGNNYQAMQWRRDNQLLITASVYPTSDCGNEMGYTEGYLLDPLTKQFTRFSERSMLELPYICTYNVWQSGDPEP